MDVKIKQMIIGINTFSRPGKKLVERKGIVMHWTACPSAPAENISNYFGRLSKQNPNDKVEDRYASAHFAVDDEEIVQIIPDGEVAYHVGSQTYTERCIKFLGRNPNNCTIGIEMCVDKNGNITEKTFQRSADLVAHLIQKHNMSRDCIWTHKGVVGWKNCPAPWVSNPAEFERFKREVNKRLSVKKNKK